MQKKFLLFCIFIFLPIYLFGENNIVAKVVGFNSFSSPPQVNIDKGKKDGITMGMKFKIMRDENVIAEGKVFYLEDSLAYLELTQLKEGEKLGFDLKAVNVEEIETKRVEKIEIKKEIITPQVIPQKTKIEEQIETKKEEQKEETQVKEKRKKHCHHCRHYYGEYYYDYLN
jgi:hypothetical protein